ncbi:flavodoxin FldA [Plectonema cf. radiosum LEGE 06105]|uniref:Flavodoxin n=1 Tax=Plectonema cf. radiosum LEGE 06105 TaxID=945769 RepID=A0A8J7FKW1_9CYAN|nr:flavodoxin FldA [Plectonema radiosum]MBE9215456.1 flavodoxin FldA [Plectonema cf. radiosum LEGE 06105]
MSKPIGLFYGTTTGKTESAAETIRDTLGGDITMHDIADAEAGDFEQYECLIIGCPTWNIGELQSDWEGFFEELDEIDFSGKTVAYFGTGDQIGYGDNFQDAMGILEEKISQRGGKTVAYTTTDGYDFNESKALRDGKFCGLALDDDNQSDLTDARIKAWTAQVKSAFGL